MKEILYIEIPTPDTTAVCKWLQTEFEPGNGKKMLTPDGFRLRMIENTDDNRNIPEKLPLELSFFVWSLQRTTYLKVFRWSEQAFPQEKQILKRLTTAIRSRFPHQYPEPPTIDLSQESIFEALAPYYPLTVKYFQKMPNGEYDLQRVYWWEQRWRQGVRNPQKPRQVVFSHKGDWEMGNSGTPRPQGVGIRGKWGDRGIRENSFPTTPPPHHPTY
ncbi:flavin-dependent dehydrogenase, partial [Fischerella thermalis WC119]